jgi:hypothetical protein
MDYYSWYRHYKMYLKHDYGIIPNIRKYNFVMAYENRLSPKEAARDTIIEISIMEYPIGSEIIVKK